MSKISHIHFAEDGRGLRNVYLDGVLVKYAVWANTKLGVVIVAKTDENGGLVYDIALDEILCETLSGEVTVEFIESGINNE